MTPQKQKYRHAEDEGQFGDCHRTCIAMILDLPRDDVPHFMEGTSMDWPDGDPRWLACEDAERAWLATRGLQPVHCAYDGSMPLSVVLAVLAHTVRNVPVILGCTSTNGGNHSVVYYNGSIFNPNDSGIKGPMRDGMWWVTTLAHQGKPLAQGQLEQLAMPDPLGYQRGQQGADS